MIKVFVQIKKFLFLVLLLLGFTSCDFQKVDFWEVEYHKRDDPFPFVFYPKNRKNATIQNKIFVEVKSKKNAAYKVILHRLTCQDFDGFSAYDLGEAPKSEIEMKSGKQNESFSIDDWEGYGFRLEIFRHETELKTYSHKETELSIKFSFY